MRNRKILNPITKKDEFILWSARNSKKYLDILELSVLVFISLFYSLIFMIRDQPSAIFVFFFITIAFLITIILSLREYLKSKKDDTLHFISNMRIGKLRIFKKDSISKPLILEDVSVNEITSIQIIHEEMKDKRSISIYFYNKIHKVFYFEDMRAFYPSLKKILFKYFDLQILEKTSNDRKEYVLKN